MSNLNAIVELVSRPGSNNLQTKIRDFIGQYSNKFGVFDVGDYMSRDPYNFSQTINVCDAIKDGATPGAARGAFSFAEPSTPNDIKLKEFINSVIKGNANIGYVDWCRKINDFKVPGNRIVGYANAINDCGLGSDKLFKDPHATVITSQGNLIDSGPSSHAQVISPWFKQPHTLTNNFLHNLGYTETDFNFGKNGDLQQFNILQKSYTSVRDLKLGNKQKNLFQDARQIIYKSLGDRLLVVYAWLFSLAHSAERTVLTTCDNVVLLWCMILGVNCIQTQNEKDKDLNKERITRVTHFMSAPIDWAIMITTERDQFLGHYNRSIGLLENMKRSDRVYFAGDVTVPVTDANRQHIFFIIDGLIRLINKAIQSINGICSNELIRSRVGRREGHTLLTELRIFKPSNLFNGADALIRSSKKIYSNDAIISQQILVGKHKQYDMYGLFTSPNISEGMRDTSLPTSRMFGGNGKYYGGMVEMEEDSSVEAAAAAGPYDSPNRDEEPYDKNVFDIDDESEQLQEIIEGKLISRDLDLSDADYRESLIDLVLDRIVSNLDCNYEDEAINEAVSYVVGEERAYAASQLVEEVKEFVAPTAINRVESKKPTRGNVYLRTATRLEDISDADKLTILKLITHKMMTNKNRETKRYSKTKKRSLKHKLKPSDRRFLITLNAMLNNASENTKKSRPGVFRSRSQSASMRMKGGRVTRKLNRRRVISKKRRPTK